MWNTTSEKYLLSGIYSIFIWFCLGKSEYLDGGVSLKSEVSDPAAVQSSVEFLRKNKFLPGFNEDIIFWKDHFNTPTLYEAALNFPPILLLLLNFLHSKPYILFLYGPNPCWDSMFPDTHSNWISAMGLLSNRVTAERETFNSSFPPETLHFLSDQCGGTGKLSTHSVKPPLQVRTDVCLIHTLMYWQWWMQMFVLITWELITARLQLILCTFSISLIFC